MNQAEQQRDKLERKRRDYERTFLEGDAGPRVLADLARFCHFDSPTTVVLPGGSVDPGASAQLEGRRIVFLRIWQFLKIDAFDMRDRMKRAEE